jgi:hypothetical protein
MWRAFLKLFLASPADYKCSNSKEVAKEQEAEEVVKKGRYQLKQVILACTEHGSSTEKGSASQWEAFRDLASL